MQPNSDEILICVSRLTLKFGIAEFATVTRPRCFGNFDKKICSKVDNNFVSSYFDGVNPIFKNSIKDTSFGKK